ncbi:MAG: DUF6452 family protein [Flavobacteriaceae bacterium]|nr:DUF6452 family protein [Flavobacteriaceae bacterium]
MKYYVFLLMLLGVLWSCEEDDICDEGKSPRMYLKFRNIDEQSAERMDSIYLWRQNTAGDFELYIFKAKTAAEDSVLVPLPIVEVTEAYFVISPKRYDVETRDTLKVDYQRVLDFGSKACGYKVNYLNVNYEISNRFFVGSEVIDTNITDEETPDLLLYY